MACSCCLGIGICLELDTYGKEVNRIGCGRDCRPAKMGVGPNGHDGVVERLSPQGRWETQEHKTKTELEHGRVSRLEVPSVADLCPPPITSFLVSQIPNFHYPN